MRWRVQIETSDSVLSESLWARLYLCYLALEWLPDEALADIFEEMEYKIQYYRDLAASEARRMPVLQTPVTRASVGETGTRPPFFLPLVED